MSRAFVKETEGGEAIEELPDREISPHPNLVTAEGLAAIDAEIARLNDDFTAAGESRALKARAERDLRYWRARRTTAEVMPPPEDNAVVRFGSSVTIVRDDGREQTWRIVGEDEADPATGSISYVSPLARSLLGHGVGDVVDAAGGEVEIVGINA